MLAVPALTLPARQAPGLPAQLDDDEFWQLIERLSEPDGFFEDENYVSNELGYERSMGLLREMTPRGVYVGVGPEQNFAYIAAVQPTMAFIVDIRRQNLVQHLMYKALFELSQDRADFLSRVFSRTRPTGLDDHSTVEAMFQAIAKAVPSTRLLDDTMSAILENLTVRHGFSLTTDDRAALRKVLSAFFEQGPELRYVFRKGTELHPTYGQMMTARDEGGRSWSYLGSLEAFERIRAMHRRNLIVPVVGDFAGPDALRAIGAYLSVRSAAVSLFYLSNVEPYLFASGRWRAFYENLTRMPLDAKGLFVRAFFGSTGRECAALRPMIRRPVTGVMTAVMNAYRAGELKSQCDLVILSR
jgi:hypothetical protein